MENMDSKRINQRKLALIRGCQFISGNRYENSVVRTSKMEELVHHRAVLEEAVMQFIYVLNEFAKPFPIQLEEHDKEHARRSEMYDKAVVDLNGAVSDSLGLQQVK